MVSHNCLSKAVRKDASLNEGTSESFGTRSELNPGSLRVTLLEAASIVSVLPWLSSKWLPLLSLVEESWRSPLQRQWWCQNSNNVMIRRSGGWFLWGLIIKAGRALRLKAVIRVIMLKSGLKRRLSCKNKPVLKGACVISISERYFKHMSRNATLH